MSEPSLKRRLPFLKHPGRTLFRLLLASFAVGFVLTVVDVRPEELLRLLDCARRLWKRHNLTIDSAMISDVPGYTWGIVPTLAHSGVRYFSIGPNHCHRIGHTLAEWGDRPQGQRTLGAFASKDLHQEVHAPAGHAAFHDVALLAWMLLDQAQGHATQPG